MADNMTAELKDILFKHVTYEIQNSNRFTTKETVHWRVLQKCAQCLKIDLNKNMDKKSIRIDPEIMQTIDDAWSGFIRNQVKLSHDDTIAYERIKSADYVNSQDVNKFVTVLQSKTNNSPLVYELLAVDGFYGYQTPNDLKNYVVHLRNDTDHIRTVRKMYLHLRDKSTSAHILIFAALLKSYEKTIRDDQVRQVVKNIAKELPKDFLVDELVSLYEKQMTNVETTATIKLAQLVARVKKTKRTHKDVNQPQEKPKKKKVKMLNVEPFSPQASDYESN